MQAFCIKPAGKGLTEPAAVKIYNRWKTENNKKKSKRKKKSTLHILHIIEICWRFSLYLVRLYFWKRYFWTAPNIDLQLNLKLLLPPESTNYVTTITQYRFFFIIIFHSWFNMRTPPSIWVMLVSWCDFTISWPCWSVINRTHLRVISIRWFNQQSADLRSGLQWTRASANEWAEEWVIHYIMMYENIGKERRGKLVNGNAFRLRQG